MIPSAYLRVFQPLDAFEREERLRWERYLVATHRDPSTRHRYVDRPTTGNLGLLAPADGDGAEVRTIDGRTYLSPWRMQMRVIAAMLSFRESEPIELWDQFVPKKLARQGRRELNRMRRRAPLTVSSCHQSPWHVPIRWFVLFRDEERWFGEDEHGRARIRYRTTVHKAMRRAEDIVAPLRRSDLGPISDLIIDLHQWMANFPPASVLELDYSSLCDLMRWDELDDDRSARDVMEAMEALERGEYPRSADIYQAVLTRWAELRSREAMN